MKFLKNANNVVYAYAADGSDDAVILPGLTPITQAEADALTALPTPSVDDLVIRIDAEADRIIRDAIGSRGQEYIDAEAGAKAYQAAGYTGTVPPSVQIWADVENKTAQWAADDILAQATAWRSASLAIRQARLVAKRDVRAGQAVAALATWAGFVAAIRSQLGLPS